MVLLILKARVQAGETSTVASTKGSEAKHLSEHYRQTGKSMLTQQQRETTTATKKGSQDFSHIHCQQISRSPSFSLPSVFSRSIRSIVAFSLSQCCKKPIIL